MIVKVQLPPDTHFQMQFRRKNMNEVWGPVVDFVTIKNSQPPKKPSKPIAAAVLGQLLVTWDGLDVDGGQYLPDLNRVEVHVGPDAAFTPGSNTMVDQFSIAGSTQQRSAGGLEYNKTYYVKLVAVNNSEVRSDPSDESHDTIKRISGIELEDGSINIDKTNLTRRGLRQSLQYNQPNPPSATNNPGNPPHYNDTWFDTDDKYRFYIYDHATPFRAQSANESWEAYYDANDAMNDLGWRAIPLGTADQVPGARVWYQPTDPAATASPPAVDGDMWYQTGQTGGTVPKVRKSGAWQSIQWGVGVAGPGSIVGDNIVGGTITGDKIKANSVTSNEIAANTILAGNIKAGAITANAIGTNEIIAAKANIKDGVIDDAKISNISAGKITVDGTMTANMILSGNIRTATANARLEMTRNGLYLYNASNVITTYLNSNSGYASITGDISARTFRSTGATTGNIGYIEIGNTGFNDPTDEIRMYYGAATSSIRNPSDLPGVIRFSLQRGYYTTAYGVTSELWADVFTTPNYFKFYNKSYGTWHSLEDQRWTLSANSGTLWAHGSDYNGNFLLRNGNSNGGAIKLVGNANPEHVQVRTAWDGAYGDMKLNTLYYAGLFMSSNPDLKKNIVKINVDAYEQLKNTELHAWDWNASSQLRGSGIGMLTTEVPMLATPPDRANPSGEEMSFDLSAVVGLLVQLGKQNREYIVQLEERIKHLETGTA